MRIFAWMVLVLAFVGCNGTSTPAPTDATDVEAEAADAAPETPAEVTPDVEEDAEAVPDVEEEAETTPPADVSEDTPPEATGDVEEEVPADVPADAPVAE